MFIFTYDIPLKSIISNDKTEPRNVLSLKRCFLKIKKIIILYKRLELSSPN
jgi:hypothetical protein